jgi:hypothetical protein
MVLGIRGVGISRLSGKRRGMQRRAILSTDAGWCRGLPCQWQLDHKDAAFTRFALDRQAPIVGVDDALHNGQP